MSEPTARGLDLEGREDGVTIVWLDAVDRRVNTLQEDLLAQFEAAVPALVADPTVRGVVIASRKADNFIAGADLDMLRTLDSRERIEAFSRRGNALLSAVAAAPFPVVAAVHGAALGGGLEVALACHAIVASDDPSTVLGLPETTLGLIPGGGGTQRLPRRIGLPLALELILTGRRIRARKAKRLGLVDLVVPPGGIADTAARVALEMAARRWTPRRSLRLGLRLLSRPPLRAAVIRRARNAARARGGSHYPALASAITCVETGLKRGTDVGLERESVEFGRLAVSLPSQRLVWLAGAMAELRRPASRTAVQRIGIVGGGLMGSGIASVSIERWPVVVRDVAEQALTRTARAARRGLDARAASGSLRAIDVARAWSHLLLTDELAALAHCDVVIEAVPEQLDLKRDIVAQLEAIVAADAVIATNTSALPIRQIARDARHPERILGMHYFSPVAKMPLLELVTAPETSGSAVERALTVARAQGKTPIVVRDGPGFYTTRILAPVLNEAMLLLEEGATVDDVDATMKRFGFPVGPVALVDEVGIDVAVHVSQSLGAAFAHRGAATSPLLERALAAGWLGRKNGIGFYTYPSRGRKRVNPALQTILRGRRATPDDLLDRVVLAMVNEAAHCLFESVVASVRDADLGAVLGLGFPPFIGGLFHYVDDRGAGAVVTALERLADRHGERFRPASPLIDAARTGYRFFPGAATGAPR